ncbi:hypothetical protein [Streptomyces scopuliridis]|uniref:hypothetical protein n=1 Tax=Streptomyces scopuliridis TaxID=452529 RepID=UPI00367AA7EE
MPQHKQFRILGRVPRECLINGGLLIKERRQVSKTTIEHESVEEPAGGAMP